MPALPAVLRRPAVVALLIGLAAQLLFSVNLGRPTKPVFDEVHYLPAARTLLTLERPLNTEHPLLGKEMIATGIAVFGDSPVGWRALSTLAGTATVLAVFAILWLLYGSLRTATYGAIFALLNMTVYIHARLAMLEPFLAAYVMLGIAALVWAMRAPPGKVLVRWTLGALLLGLATAVKWTAAPYVVFAGLAFAVLRLRRKDLWPGLGLLTGLAVLGVASVAIYFATFVPVFFYADQPLAPARLLAYQLDMLRQQTQVLTPHPYQSNWTTWPLMIRPIWYLYEPVDGAVRGILYIGNPVVMWGGLAAVAALGWTGWRRRDPRAGAIALLWVASLAMWAIIPKSHGFYYYYYLSGIILCVAIPAALHPLEGTARHGWIYWIAIAALACFVYFYPIISAAALPDPQAFNRWVWFNSWR
jgi:dolichyl-phosphate-mannose-protein mannosyltransferase